MEAIYLKYIVWMTYRHSVIQQWFAKYNNVQYFIDMNFLEDC